MFVLADHATLIGALIINIYGCTTSIKKTWSKGYETRHVKMRQCNLDTVPVLSFRSELSFVFAFYCTHHRGEVHVASNMNVIYLVMIIIVLSPP